jgi:hypothetical protein
MECLLLGGTADSAAEIRHVHATHLGPWRHWGSDSPAGVKIIVPAVLPAENVAVAGAIDRVN